MTQEQNQEQNVEKKGIDHGTSIIPVPGIEIQEDTDNWGFLFNPATDFSFGVNPVSVFIWKELVHRPTIADLIVRVQQACSHVPAEIGQDIEEFIGKLLANGMVTLGEAHVQQ